MERLFTSKMNIPLPYLRQSFFRTYRSFVFTIYTFQAALAVLWHMGQLGACHFNGTAMADCTFGGSNIDGIVDMLLSIWMIPVIGIPLGLVAPWVVALMPSFVLWLVFLPLELFRERVLAAKNGTTETMFKTSEKAAAKGGSFAQNRENNEPR